MDDDETTFHVEQSDNESKVHEAEEQTLDATENDESITLVSNDHIRVKVRKSYLKNSGLLQTILETGVFHFFFVLQIKKKKCLDKTVEEVKLASLDGESLGYVMQYILHHKGEDTKEIEKPIKSKFMKDNVQVTLKKMLVFLKKKKLHIFFLVSMGCYLFGTDHGESRFAIQDAHGFVSFFLVGEINFNCFKAANYLDMNVFLKLLCSSVAALIKGMFFFKKKNKIYFSKVNHGKKQKKSFELTMDLKAKNRLLSSNKSQIVVLWNNMQPRIPTPNASKKLQQSPKQTICTMTPLRRQLKLNKTFNAPFHEQTKLKIGHAMHVFVQKTFGKFFVVVVSKRKLKINAFRNDLRLAHAHMRIATMFYLFVSHIFFA